MSLINDALSVKPHQEPHPDGTTQGRDPRRARADWWRVTGSDWMAHLPPETIALHAFADGPGGRRCTKCGRAWVDISWAGPEHVGWDGIACHGKLTEAEAEQIVRQRDAEFEAGRGA